MDATGGGFAAGVIAVQIACIGWSTGSTFSRRYGRSENVLAAAAIHMLAGGTFMLVLGTFLGEWPRLSFTPTTLLSFIYLILIGGIGGFGAYIYALKHLPVATVSLYAYVNPGSASPSTPGWRSRASSFWPVSPSSGRPRPGRPKATRAKLPRRIGGHDEIK
jgi:drug/metabolite transporter (DMT)-like permease